MLVRRRRLVGILERGLPDTRRGVWGKVVWGGCACWSGDDIADYVSGDIGEAVFATVVEVG